MLTEEMKITGELTIELRDAQGVLLDYRRVPNIVTTAGKTVIADRMSLAVPTKTQMTHMGVGTNNTAPSAGDTTLNTQLARVALASVTPAVNVVTYVATFPAGTATGALVEAGLFNANVAGDMLCRSTFAVVTKNATDSLTITWAVTVN